MEEKKEVPFSSQLTALKKLEKYIEEKIEKSISKRVPEPYESEKTDLLCTALAKAQGEFPKIETNRANNFLFNQYSDLDIIMRTIRNALSLNGLSITQQTKLDNEKTILVTRLRHKSAQFIETRSRIIPSKNDIQSYASAIKAMKRHDIMSLLNITIVDDLDDDDAECDMQTVRMERTKGTGINTRYSAKRESFQPISEDQADELQYMLSEYPDIAEQILETLKVQTIADIPKSKFLAVRAQAQKIIDAREGKNKH
jgi:hypothetical protein